MAAPFARSPVTISTFGTLVSAPYVDMTARMMEDFGLVRGKPFWWTDTPFAVPVTAGQRISSYGIEPDASAASYFCAAAAIAGGSDHRRGIWAARACKATSRSSICLSRWVARSSRDDADDGQGRTVAGHRRRHERHQRHGHDAGRGRLFRRWAHDDPQRRPHPPQGNRPHRRPGHRAAQARRRSRRARRRADDHARGRYGCARSTPTTTTAWR